MSAPSLLTLTGLAAWVFPAARELRGAGREADVEE